VTYALALLIENVYSEKALSTILPQVYGVLGYLVFLLGYLFIHVRYTTTSILKARFFEIVRVSAMKRFLTSQGHKDGIMPTGKTISVYQDWINSWMSTIVSIAAEVIPAWVCLTVGLFYIGLTNHLAFIVAIPYLAATSSLILWARSKAVVFQRQKKIVTVHFVRDFVRGILEKQMIQLARRVDHELTKLTKLSKEFLRLTRSTDIYNSFSWWFSRISIDIYRMSAILYIWYSVAQGTATIGEIVIVGMVFATMNRYYDTLLEFFQQFQDDWIHISEYWKYEDALIPFIGYSQGSIFTPNKKGLELQWLDFKYPNNGESVFAGFNLTIKSGITTAIVGRSGAGKSTLVKLILGLLTPTGGRIIVDGQDLSTVALESYYRSIAYLPQEPAIFDGTIRDNLNYSLTEAADEKTLKLALKKAECDFVDHLPHGLDTEIGERGIRLSGGERQRLAIARILLQDPEIILLDEPTSALDSFSEEAVTRAMHATFPGKTVIIIAHRLQTVKDADTIIVLGKNEVLETGTHASLIHKKGHYASMVDLQSGALREDSQEA
jgi:ABC-type multidrug transport system fused ATPase/permease subunit